MIAKQGDDRLLILDRGLKVHSDIALIIGNGLSINFSKFHNMDKFSDTQNPTKWPIKTLNSDKPLLDLLPNMKQFFEANAGANDFDIFKRAVDIYKETEHGTLYFGRDKDSEEDVVILTPDYLRDIIPLECRHFLCLAFSAYSLECKRKLNKDWPWYSWLHANRSRLSAVCSFNYDLIIEYALNKMVKSFYCEGSTYKFGSIPLYKPHGSCNYEATGLNLPATYPLTSYIDNFDSQIKQLEEWQYMLPRIVPHCVLPNQENIYSHFNSMRYQEEKFYSSLMKVNYCVIIGHSYADVDRPEIDSALTKLKEGSTVIIADPFPSEALKDKVLTLGLKLECWTSFLGPVDDSGKLLNI